MTSALELECGCCICTKCVIKHNRKHHIRTQSTHDTPMTIHSQYLDEDKNTFKNTIECPVCS